MKPVTVGMAYLLALMAAETAWTEEEITWAIGAPDGVICPLLGVNTGPRLLLRAGGERDFTEALRRICGWAIPGTPTEVILGPCAGRLRIRPSGRRRR